MGQGASPWIEFPAFRRYEAIRQQANNAMMALLAGSKLAAHTLQLTAGSSRLLPEIFPGVDHITYFNLRTADATDLLTNVGHHLGAVAVPYALAVHEDFVMTVLDMLGTLGYTCQAPGQSPDLTKNRVTAWNMHEAVWLTLGQPVPSGGSCVPLEHFHLLREMRNTHIHSGGAISPRLLDEVTTMSATAEAAWHRLSHRTPATVVSTGQLEFTTFDIFAAFATTKSLGRTINHLLRDHLPLSTWGRLCVEDYAVISSKSVGSDRWIRGLLGHAAMNYGAKPLPEQDVIDAAVVAGAWTQGKSWTARRAPRSARTKRNPGTKPGFDHS